MIEESGSAAITDARSDYAYLRIDADQYL